MKFIVVLAAVFFVLECCQAADKTAEGNGISVRVLGKSGKIVVRKKDKGENSAVMIVMDEISELSAAGKKVGKSGKVKHSFNTFANQDFTFTALKSRTYENVSVQGFDFKAMINGAELIVSVNIFKEDGVILNDNEEIEVKRGMVKNDISISNWTFCNPCKAGNKDEFGNKLQFTITIKGKRDGPKMKPARNATKAGRKRAPSYDLGGNATLVLSKKYKLGNIWKDMQSGYPKLVTVGSKKSFVFRFEKFNTSVSYDPLIDSTNSETDDDSSGQTVKVSLCVMIFVSFFYIIHNVF